MSNFKCNRILRINNCVDIIERKNAIFLEPKLEVRLSTI